jgi:hypothetical protein
MIVARYRLFVFGPFDWPPLLEIDIELVAVREVSSVVCPYVPVSSTISVVM